MFFSVIQQKAGEWLLKQLNTMKGSDGPINLTKESIFKSEGKKLMLSSHGFIMELSLIVCLFFLLQMMKVLHLTCPVSSAIVSDNSLRSFWQKFSMASWTMYPLDNFRMMKNVSLTNYSITISIIKKNALKKTPLPTFEGPSDVQLFDKHHQKLSKLLLKLENSIHHSLVFGKLLKASFHSFTNFFCLITMHGIRKKSKKYLNFPHNFTTSCMQNLLFIAQ